MIIHRRNLHNSWHKNAPQIMQIFTDLYTDFHASFYLQ